MKKIDLATTSTIDSSYAGEVAGEIIGQAFLEADTIAKNLITVHPKVTYKLTVRKIEYSNGIQDFSCGFTPAGAVDLSEVVLEPKELKNDLEFCKATFKQTWDASSMGFGASNDDLPKDEKAAILTEVLASTAEKIELDLWQGDKTVNGEFDGFLIKLAASSDVVKVTGSALTKSNILGELEKILDAIPKNILNKKLNWAVPYQVQTLYKQAIGAADYMNTGTVGDKPLDYLGNDLVPVAGMPVDTIVVFETKNMNLATGLTSDYNDIKILDMADRDGSDNVRMIMKYTADTNFVVPEEIVTYGV